MIWHLLKHEKQHIEDDELLLGELIQEAGAIETRMTEVAGYSVHLDFVIRYILEQRGFMRQIQEVHRQNPHLKEPTFNFDLQDSLKAFEYARQFPNSIVAVQWSFKANYERRLKDVLKEVRREFPNLLPSVFDLIRNYSFPSEALPLQRFEYHQPLLVEAQNTSEINGALGH